MDVFVYSYFQGSSKNQDKLHFSLSCFIYFQGTSQDVVGSAHVGALARELQQAQQFIQRRISKRIQTIYPATTTRVVYQTYNLMVALLLNLTMMKMQLERTWKLMIHTQMVFWQRNILFGRAKFTAQMVGQRGRGSPTKAATWILRYSYDLGCACLIQSLASQEKYFKIMYRSMIYSLNMFEMFSLFRAILHILFIDSTVVDVSSYLPDRFC